MNLILGIFARKFWNPFMKLFTMCILISIMSEELKLDCFICLVLLKTQVPTADFMAVTKIPRNSKD